MTTGRVEVYLSEGAKELLTKICSYEGLDRSSVMEFLVRYWAVQLGLTVTQKKEPLIPCQGSMNAPLQDTPITGPMT